MSEQANQQSFCIFSDKVFYERLKSVEESQCVKVTLFTVRNCIEKTVNFVILDVVRCKPSNDLKKFQSQQFYTSCQQILNNQRIPQVFIYQFSKQTISQLLNEQNSKIRIVCPQKITQLNNLTRQCIILTLELPNDFYLSQDSQFNLQGYKFNPIGKVRQAWSHISNGRVMRAIFNKQNQKVKRQLQENKIYSKNELTSILQIIRNINNLSGSQSQLQQQQNNKSSSFLHEEQLRVLGENYFHGDKFISNSNATLPIINYQINLLCSMTRGESCKNQLRRSNATTNSKVLHHVCLNLSQGVKSCEDIINQKIKQIFTTQNHNDEENPKKSPTQNILLTNMPTKISNPHLFLKTEFKDKFQQFYVKGFYEYFHYGDHNFNDQGWGCAYRSLQTLLSWFRLQQKLNLLTVPTVPEIQNLIDIIDCTSQQKLSNTNTWIGATEVSWVVKKLTGYDCRIIHIQDGKDIVQHAQVFRDHLQNVGTPIMYGGGEYAYSIVGINYSWKLGEIMFLILDPHYNGSDKIQKIIEKKGICWRKPEQMFKKGVFYNFCLSIL